MGLLQYVRSLFNSVSYSGHDRRGNAIYLAGRDSDPTLCDMPGIPTQARDQALAIVCESFDIPLRQMHCLRPSDELMAIYRSMVGPRWCDEMQFEALWLELDDLPGPQLTEAEALAIQTVGDVMRIVASRQGSP